MKQIDELIERRRDVWPLGGYAPGSYFCKCGTCGEQYDGDKRSFCCLPCAVKAANDGLAKLAELEVEVQAAKDFGGGFYADVVSEQTRKFYRDDVLKRKGDSLLRALRSISEDGK